MKSASIKTLLLLSAAFFLATPAYAQGEASTDALDPSQPAHQSLLIEEGDGGVTPNAHTSGNTPENTPKNRDSLSGQVYLQPAASDAAPVTGSAQSARVSNQPLLDALRAAYISNPTLQAARAEMRATSEFLPQAQSGWMPSANASGTVTTADIDPGRTGDGTTSTALGASITQPLYRGGRTVSGIDSAESRIKAQAAILNATEQQLLLNVATAYMNVVRDRALVDLSENNITVVNRQLDASRNRFEVGEVTRTDVAQSQARLARAQANRTTAIGNLKSSLAAYEQLVGAPSDNLVQPTMAFAFPPTLDEALAAADKSNPLIAASQYLHEAAEKDIGVVFGELLPELGLSANVERTWDPQPGLVPDTTSKSLSLVATIPLYEGGYTRSRVRQAKFTANRRYIEIMETRREARQNVISNWETWKASQAEITSRQSQVDANLIAQEGVRQEAELGTRTILDALDADQEYLDAQVALVSAQRDEIVASFALARALGMLTPAALGFPELAYNATHDRDIADWKMLGMDVDRVP